LPLAAKIGQRAGKGVTIDYVASVLSFSVVQIILQGTTAIDAFLHNLTRAQT
jgi:hypothetical protein